MNPTIRREFLRQTAAAGAAFTLFSVGARSYAATGGANSKVRLAVVGVNGRGKTHLDELSASPNVEIAYVIDVDENQYGAAVKFLESRGAPTPKCRRDIRTALDDPSIDGVTIATPNHTHSLYTIWACQAGKHVYVEKPLSHDVWEGRQCVAAANKYQRVVQHGTQSRSQEDRAIEIAAVHSGKFGKLLVAKGYCCKPRWSIGTQLPGQPPATLDFDRWLGPAAAQPYHANLVHYNWHWFWDFGNGDTGNQGVHEIDLARWGIAGAKLPTKVWTVGGRFGYQDQGETPNTLLSVFDFDDAKLVFETRGLVGKHAGHEQKIFTEFYTTDGVIRGGKFYADNQGNGEALTGVEPLALSPGGPFGNFIAAIRADRPDLCNASVEDGHYSSALCHLANVSYRMGESAPLDSATRREDEAPQIVESLKAIRSNLAAVGVDLGRTECVVGKTLTIDPQTELCVDDSEADRLFRRQGRAPYAIPTNV